MDRHVFISYSRNDQEFVDRLCADLRKSGVDAWQDVREIAPGQNWEAAITRALFSASVLLYVASAESAASRYVKLELGSVLRRARVIPLILDDVGAQQLPKALAAFQWIDFRRQYDAAFAQLLESLKHLRGSGPVEPEPKKSKGYVFISYAEEDTVFVARLKAFLATRGYGYWDYSESDRNYHHDLYLELEAVITEAAGTLSVLSPDWKRSPAAIKEFHFSNEVGTPVFLLKVRELGPTLVISGIPYIDFTRDEEAGFAKLDRELGRKGL